MYTPVLVVTLLLGVLVSYTDVTKGKIHNKHLLAALIGGVIFFSLHLVVVTTTPYTLTVLGSILLKSLLAFALGFLLWYAGIWSAADSKLATALFALVLMSQVPSSITVTSFYVNIMVISFFVTMLLLFSKVTAAEVWQAIFDTVKQSLRPKKIGTTLASLIAISGVLRIGFQLIGMPLDSLMLTLLTILSSYIIYTYIKIKFTFLLGTALLVVLFDSATHSLQFVKTIVLLFIIWILLLSMLKGSLSQLSKQAFTELIPVIHLKEGMVLSEVITELKHPTSDEIKSIQSNPDLELHTHNNKYYVKTMKGVGTFNSFIDEEAEGVTKHNIKQLKTLGFTSIRVSQTIAYAPLITVSALLTLIITTSIPVLIKSLV